MINNFEDWWNEIGSTPPLAEHDQEEHTKRIAEIAWNTQKPIDHFSDSFVVVVENDNAERSRLRSNGPLALETQTGKSSLIEAIDKANSIGGRYGWNLICRLEVLGNADECMKLLNKQNNK